MTLSATFLRGILAYDPLTGIFIWRERFDVPDWWNTKYAKKVAGSLDAYGYWVIRINGKTYKAHRLAWVYVTGRGLPDTVEIDHEDGQRARNVFTNLREASDQQNAVNAGLRQDNSSGAKGVSWHRGMRKWRVQINEGGRRRSLGYFDSPVAAQAAYQKRAIALHDKFVRAL